jgi:hypothetical protein
MIKMINNMIEEVTAERAGEGAPPGAAYSGECIAGWSGDEGVAFAGECVVDPDR